MPNEHAFALAAARCQERFGEAPSGAVVLGSGAGVLLDRIDVLDSCSYADIGLPATGAPGHAGKLVVAELGGRRLALMSGRVHSYEVDSLEPVVRGVRAMATWGVEKLIMTSAVGSLRTDYGLGDLVRITDHINLMGINPLVGPNIDSLGPRFPDMATAYDPQLGALAKAEADRLGLTMHAGVYAAVRGPSYETPAEVRMLAQVGGQVVGMSVVPETIAAVHAGMRVLAISVVSNHGTGLSDAPIDHAAVTEVVGRASDRLVALISAVVSKW
jgi:purine-nucleoside phosphorylase